MATRDEIRALDPDFTAFVDDCNAVFGKCRVAHIRMHDGSFEMGADPLAGASLMSSDAWKKLGTYRYGGDFVKQFAAYVKRTEDEWKARNGKRGRR